MTPLADLLAQGGAHAWLFVPSAILLGALHGLEPGHSKTMMAAFIIAIRGTVTQAILLGLAATVSHTAVVWLVAMSGLTLGANTDTEAIGPYLQLVSGVIIVIVAGWMAWTTWRHHRRAVRDHHHHDHAHGDHAHGDHGHGGHEHAAEHRLALGLDVVEGGDVDAHELAHANDIRRRFATANVTTPQIIAFGLTGGLIPCPAAITVLLLCLQLKKIALGATLVLGFSVGLALTLVTTGVVAALAAGQAAKRWSGFGEVARRAPYLSAALITAVGGYLIVEGWLGLAA